jgi:ATP-binding cassette subfamily B protein
MAIEVSGVSFAYPGSPHPVIRDVSFTVAPGETIAIVGENGAGKSTLIRLITGLYLPDAGTVMLDGKDTRGNGDAMHQIGAVFQDYLAYQLPLRDNIGFGDPMRAAERHHLERAARQAGIAELVDAMPEGFDTWLGRQFGERDLSGGQWQRVALARAFYRDADLLILDEPTAALDPKAEQALFERFASLVEDRTSVMISHRLASARFADRILVMDQGRLVEQGSHAALIRQGGLYARMFAAQAEWYR